MNAPAPVDLIALKRHEILLVAVPGIVGRRAGCRLGPAAAEAVSQKLASYEASDDLVEALRALVLLAHMLELRHGPNAASQQVLALANRAAEIDAASAP